MWPALGRRPQRVERRRAMRERGETGGGPGQWVAVTRSPDKRGDRRRAGRSSSVRAPVDVRLRSLVQLHFGLDGRRPLAVTDLAEQFQMTCTAVVRAIRKAQRQLRSAARSASTLS